MSLVVLPALRLSAVQRRLGESGLDYGEVQRVMQVIEDEIERGARRVGNLCPLAGCRNMLDQHGTRARGWCSEHGYVEGPYPLLIAFDPVR